MGLAVTRAAMSEANGLLGQKLCHCLNQGRTLNDILMRAAHWMAYFDLRKLNLAYTNVMQAFKFKMQWCRRDTVALRTTCVKNVKFKIIKKDRLSVFGILSLQRKPQLGRTKPLTGLHAALGPRVGHSWARVSERGQRFTSYAWKKYERTQGKIIDKQSTLDSFLV